jgi:hypothetical protein
MPFLMMRGPEIGMPMSDEAIACLIIGAVFIILSQVVLYLWETKRR